MKRLKILVFDDNEIHRTSAKLTLSDHDLTIVGTYDEAKEALVPKRDDKKASQLMPDLLRKVGLAPDFTPWSLDRSKIVSDEDKKKYSVAEREARELSTTYPALDVVMTDLLVPASAKAQGFKGLQFVGQEMPLGAVIALLALTARVKNVAVVTDMGHHDHPASAALDCFVLSRHSGINILCTNRVDYITVDIETNTAVSLGFLESEAGLEKYPYLRPNEEGWGERKGLTTGGKDWGEILRQLVGGGTGTTD